jgi:hypothetical protein
MMMGRLGKWTFFYIRRIGPSQLKPNRPLEKGNDPRELYPKPPFPIDFIYYKRLYIIYPTPPNGTFDLNTADEII